MLSFDFFGGIPMWKRPFVFVYLFLLLFVGFPVKERFLKIKKSLENIKEKWNG